MILIKLTQVNPRTNTSKFYNIELVREWDETRRAYKYQVNTRFGRIGLRGLGTQGVSHSGTNLAVLLRRVTTIMNTKIRGGYVVAESNFPESIPQFLQMNSVPFRSPNENPAQLIIVNPTEVLAPTTVAAPQVNSAYADFLLSLANNVENFQRQNGSSLDDSQKSLLRSLVSVIPESITSQQNAGVRKIYSSFPNFEHKSLRAITAADRNQVFRDKRPLAEQRDNFIGVEIECFTAITRDVLVSYFVAKGLMSYITVKSDGSIRATDSGNPHEICILMKESEVGPVMDKVKEVFDEASVQVNSTCGLHVHIDMRHRNHEVCFHNFLQSQRFLYRMNPTSRYTNTYCYPIRTDNPQRYFTTPKYAGVSTHHISGKRTIEIRLHGGTSNADKIKNWVSLLVGIASKTERVTLTSNKVSEFFNSFGFDRETRIHVANRINKFMLGFERIINDQANNNIVQVEMDVTLQGEPLSPPVVAQVESASPSSRRRRGRPTNADLRARAGT